MSLILMLFYPTTNVQHYYNDMCVLELLVGCPQKRSAASSTTDAGWARGSAAGTASWTAGLLEGASACPSLTFFLTAFLFQDGLEALTCKSGGMLQDSWWELTANPQKLAS